METVGGGFNTDFHNPSPFLADVALSNGCLGNEWEMGGGSFGVRFVGLSRKTGLKICPKMVGLPLTSKR